MAVDFIGRNRSGVETGRAPAATILGRRGGGHFVCAGQVVVVVVVLLLLSSSGGRANRTSHFSSIEIVSHGATIKGIVWRNISLDYHHLFNELIDSSTCRNCGNGRFEFGKNWLIRFAGGETGKEEEEEGEGGGGREK